MTHDDLRGWDVRIVPRSGHPNPTAIATIAGLGAAWCAPWTVGVTGYALGAGEWWAWTSMLAQVAWAAGWTAACIHSAGRDDRTRPEQRRKVTT